VPFSWPPVSASDSGSASEAGSTADAASCELLCTRGNVALTCGGERLDTPNCTSTQVFALEATVTSTACTTGTHEFGCSTVSCTTEHGVESGTTECSGEGSGCSVSWGEGRNGCGLASAEGGASATDVSSNATWEREIRDTIEARREAVGCAQRATVNRFVSDAARQLAEGWADGGIEPYQDNAVLQQAGVLGPTHWFAVSAQLLSSLTDSAATEQVTSVVEANADCTPASLGVAVVGDPGQQRMVVIVLSQCEDCGDACRLQCADAG
jgi:hypothetical protein